MQKGRGIKVVVVINTAKDWLFVLGNGSDVIPHKKDTSTETRFFYNKEDDLWVKPHTPKMIYNIGIIYI